jgi:hypothetical protein
LLVKNRISRAFILEHPSVSAAKRLPVQCLTSFVPQIENLPERMEICGQG